MIVVEIQGKVPCRYFRDKTDKYWIAVCDSLKLTWQAHTWWELQEMISQTINAIFADLLETDDLEHFLKDHDWQLSKPIPKHERNVRFDIPWFLVERSANDFAR